MSTSRRPELSAASSPSVRRLLRLSWPLLCLLPAPALLAQSPTEGAVHGVILDPTRHPIAGALLTLAASDGSERRATTAADGSFLLLHLVPDQYAVSAGATSDLLPLVVNAGETTELRVQLRPGRIEATLQVLPSSTEPSAPPQPDQDEDGLASLNGLSALQQTQVVDGADTTQSYNSVPAGSGSDPAPDPDGNPDDAERTTGPPHGLGRGRHAGVSYLYAQSSVREFRVAGLGYSAQTAHAGAVSTLITRSGTAEFHGSASFALRSQALAATNPLAIASSYADGVVTRATVKPHDLRETFGASVGGPVPRIDALRFFYSFEGQQRGFPAIASPADPNFFALSASERAVLANRGVTSAAINAGLNFLSSLTGETPRSSLETLHFGRLDWRQSLALEYQRIRWNSPAGLLDAPVVARGRASLGNASGSLDAVILRASTSLLRTGLNQAQFAFAGDLQYETPQTPLPQEPAIAPGGLAPEVNIGPNGLLFGTPASLSQHAFPDERRFEFADTLTLPLGRHLLAAGVSFALIDEAVSTLANSAGTFRYDGTVTSSNPPGYTRGLADFLTDSTFNAGTIPNGGCPAITAPTHLFCFRSFSQSFGPASAAFSTQDWSAFLEDTWRPRPALTLHAGARYEYTLFPLPQAPNAALDAVFGARGASSVFPEDRNNLGPRGSLAWEPFGPGRGLVRAGFGLFFGRVPGATLRAALSDTALASSTTRIRIRPSTSVACPQVPQQGFGYPCAFVTKPSGTASTTASAVVFDRRFRTPVVEQGSLTLEREIAPRTSLSATYVLNLDRQLPGSTDLNIAPSTAARTFQLVGGTGAPGVQSGELFSVPIYTSRLSPAFGPVTDIVSNVNASYHALTLAAESQPSGSLRVSASYTWSKAIDFGQTLSATPRTSSQFDPFNHGFDKALSALNYPWSLRGTAVWTPAVPHRLRLAGGWQFAPILRAHAGRPYSLDLSGGTFLPGGHESINGSGGALYLPTVGRNTLRLPAVATLNLRAAREFRPTHGTHLLASAEAFNLLNHPVISSVNQRAYVVGKTANGTTPLVFQDAPTVAAEGLATAAFGAPTGAGTSLARERQLQFTLNLLF